MHLGRLKLLERRLVQIEGMLSAVFVVEQFASRQRDDHYYSQLVICGLLASMGPSRSLVLLSIADV